MIKRNRTSLNRTSPPLKESLIFYDLLYGDQEGYLFVNENGLVSIEDASGVEGPQGEPGADGKTILNGTIAPTNLIGVDGDFYINTTTNTLYGPKASGVWPSGVSLIGPTGATGPQGPTGATGATGATGPAGANGTNGIDGVDGADGTNGTNGIDGADGTDGATWHVSSSAPTSLDGVDGDLWWRTNGTWYGPKFAGSWSGPYVIPVALHASTHQHGGSDEIGSATPAADTIPKSNGSGKLDSWISAADATTSGIAKLGASGGAQEYAAVLASLVSDAANTGLLVITATDTITSRSVTAGNGISVTNGNGISGNIEVAVSFSTYDMILYGNGEDGNLVFDGLATINLANGVSIAPVAGVYTLTSDIAADVLTMSSSAIIKTAGYIIRCKELVGTVNEVIQDNGNDGTSGSTGGGAAISASGTLRRTSGAGAGGRSTTGVGTSATSVSNSKGAQGGAGGLSGVNAGGNGGTVTAPAATASRTFYGLPLIHGWLQTTSALGAQVITGGSGGGGGASGGGNSGAGGSGGGHCRVYAWKCSFEGTLKAEGGNGGNANGGGANGGGGGGGGGYVCLITSNLAVTPTLSAAGGNGGNGNNGGGNGSAGSAGTTEIISP